jgi:hypothetical protein
LHRTGTKKTIVDSESQRSGGSAGKARRIGGIARRINARESVRNLREFKKNASIREQSMANSESPPRESQKPELNLSSSVAQFEIKFNKSGM